MISASSSCPVASIVGTTATSLTALGASSNSNLTLEPDLAIVGYLFACFIGVAFVIGFFSRFRQQKRVSLSTSLTIDQSALGGSFGLANEFLELYKKLEVQKNIQGDYLERSKGDLQAFCHRISAETEQVKALLVMKLLNFDDGNSESIEQRKAVALDTSEKLLWGEISARKMFRNRISSHEEEIWKILLSLQSLFAHICDKHAFTALETTKWQENSESISEHLKTMHEILSDERRRRVLLSDQTELVGGHEIYSILISNDEKEIKSQEAYISMYKAISESLNQISSRFLSKQAEYQIRKAELQVSSGDHAANSSSTIVAIQNLDSQFEKSTITLMNDSNVLITQFMSTVASNRDVLYHARESVTESQSRAVAALTRLRQRLQNEINIASKKKKSQSQIVLDPMLQGLHPDLQRALCILLQQLGIIERSNDSGAMKLTSKSTIEFEHDSLEEKAQSNVDPLFSISKLPSDALTSSSTHFKYSANSSGDAVRDQILAIAKASGISPEQMAAALFGNSFKLSSASSAPVDSNMSAIVQRNLDSSLSLISATSAELVSLLDLPASSLMIKSATPTISLGPLFDNVTILVGLENELSMSEVVLAAKSGNVSSETAERELNILQRQHNNLAMAIEASKQNYLESREILLAETELVALTDQQKDSLAQEKSAINLLRDTLRQEALDLESELLAQERDNTKKNIEKIDELRHQFEIQRNDLQNEQPSSSDLSSVELEAFEQARELRIKHLEVKCEKEIALAEASADESRLNLRNRHQVQRELLHQRQEATLNEKIKAFEIFEAKMKQLRDSAITSVTVPDFTKDIEKSIEYQSLIKEHRRALQAIERKHEDELLQLNSVLKQKETAAELVIKRKSEESRDILIDEMKQDLQKELLRFKEDPEASKLILEQCQAKVLRITNESETSRDIKIQEAKTQHAVERRHQIIDLQRKQKALLSREEELQKKEENNTFNSAAIKKEKDLVMSLCLADNRSEARAIIERITTGRFSSERSSLLSRQWKDIADAICKEYNSAMRAVNVYKTECRAKVESMEISQETSSKMISKFEATQLDPSRIEISAAMQFQKLHKTEIDALRKSQNATVREYFKMAYPDETFESNIWIESKSASELQSSIEIEEKRQKAEQDALTAKMSELRAQEQEFRLKKEKQYSDEIAAMEERLKMQQKELEADLELKYQRQREEEDRKRKEILKQQLAQSGTDPNAVELKNQLLAQAKQDSAAASLAIDAQMEEQKLKLRARLNKEQDKVKLQERKRKEEELKRELEIEQEVINLFILCKY